MPPASLLWIERTQASSAASPSSNATCGRQPRSVRAAVVSAAVRRTSPCCSAARSVWSRWPASRSTSSTTCGQRGLGAAADVVDRVGVVGGGGAQRRVAGVGDEREVARLLSVAVDLERRTVEYGLAQLAECHVRALAWAVDGEVAQSHRSTDRGRSTPGPGPRTLAWSPRTASADCVGPPSLQGKTAASPYTDDDDAHTTRRQRAVCAASKTCWVATMLSRAYRAKPSPKLPRTPGWAARWNTTASCVTAGCQPRSTRSASTRLNAGSSARPARLCSLAGRGVVVGEGVDPAHPPAVGDEALAQVGADEAGGTGDDGGAARRRAGHDRPPRRPRPDARASPRCSCWVVPEQPEGGLAVHQLARRTDLDDPPAGHDDDQIGVAGQAPWSASPPASCGPASARRCRPARARSLSASRPVVGSSSTSTGGSRNSTRAMPMRCRWPPDSPMPPGPSGVS